MSGNESTSTHTEFRWYKSDNIPDRTYPPTIQDHLWNAVQDAWDDQLDTRFTYGNNLEATVTEAELEPYIDTSIDGSPILEAWLNWMEQEQEWKKDKGIIQIFAVDTTSGQWSDWSEGWGGVSGAATWHQRDKKWAFVPSRSRDTTADIKRRVLHEVGHICLSPNTQDHGIGDHYRDDTSEYDGDTVMYSEPPYSELCGKRKQGELPYAWIYGDATIEAIENYIEYNTATCTGRISLM